MVDNWIQIVDIRACVFWVVTGAHTGMHTYLNDSSRDKNSVSFAQEISEVCPHQREAENRHVNRGIFEWHMGHVAGRDPRVWRHQVERENLYDCGHVGEHHECHKRSVEGANVLTTRHHHLINCAPHNELAQLPCWKRKRRDVLRRNQSQRCVPWDTSLTTR